MRIFNFVFQNHKKLVTKKNRYFTVNKTNEKLVEKTYFNSTDICAVILSILYKKWQNIIKNLKNNNKICENCQP